MSKKLAGVILAALGLVATACTTGPKNYVAPDLPMYRGNDPNYCKTHSDILECRQNTNPY